MKKGKLLATLLCSASMVMGSMVPCSARGDIHGREAAVAEPAKGLLARKDQRHGQAGGELDGGEGVAEAVVRKPLFFQPGTGKERRQQVCGGGTRRAQGDGHGGFSSVAVGCGRLYWTGETAVWFPGWA